MTLEHCDEHEKYTAKCMDCVAWRARFSELYRVVAPHFTAGFDVQDGECFHAAPILKWARGKPLIEIRNYCVRKGWEIALVPRRSPVPLALNDTRQAPRTRRS